MVEGGAALRIAGFLDGNAERHGHVVHGLPVLGGIEWLKAHPDAEVVVAVGSPAVRKRLVASIAALGHERFGRIVHPAAIVGRRVEIGSGSIVLQAASITTDARLGRHVVVNPGATIAHDCVVDDFVLVAPGANVSGAVRLGEGADVGTNAAILQTLAVGAWSVVGAGAVVREPVPPDVTVVGVPARVVRRRPNGWQTHL